MDLPINISFEQLLSIIRNLKSSEKKEVAKLLIEETDISDAQWNEAVKRKKDFEEGRLEAETWGNLKKRLLN